MADDTFFPELGLEGYATLSECGQYRYDLVRSWDEDKNYVCFVMLNPSTADAKKDDPTIRRCIGYAQLWGYGGLVVVNLFAYRATDPGEIRLMDYNRAVGPDNDAFIKLWTRTCPMVVAAWGAFGRKRNRDLTVMKMLNKYQVKVHCLGLTEGQDPKHPLYLSKDLKPTPYLGRRRS